MLNEWKKCERCEKEIDVPGRTESNFELDL